MAIDAEKFASEKLDAFKERMRISNNEEDNNLKRMLRSSVVAIVLLVGATEVEDMLTELVFERARYVYHDALDEFQRNYSAEIELQYVINKMKGEESDDA